jgi:SSS family solute:Na+ symporter
VTFDLYNFILLGVCLFFVIFGLVFSQNEKSISSYLNAGRSIQSSSLTASIVASCFGVWILIGPSEAATWGGIGAVIGYAFGQACPYLAMNVLGPRLRAIMPNGNSLTQFVFARYGKSMLQLILILSVFYMFIYLCAEVTAIAKVVQLISGTALWKTSLIILVSTLIYTLKGGLRISILTDKFQFVIISIFLVLIFYYLFFSGKVVIDTHLIASKASVLIDPKYFYGYTAGITFFIAVFATNLFDQGVWQRVFAAQSTTRFKKRF